MSSFTTAPPAADPFFQDWIGRAISVDDEVTLPAVRRIAAMVDLDPSTFARGDAIPRHWYCMFFTANARKSQIGHDGHPRKGEFLPPIALPRRMFVGRSVAFPGVLRIGDQASKKSEIVAITPKSGRSGPLVFVTVRHTIEVGGQAVVVEDQEVVYREAAGKHGNVSSTAASAPAQAAWHEQVCMDPVLVFRYSAVTWNGHRIHYDAEYARREEGYPGCVMNGALTLHLLIDAALRHADRPLLGLTAKLVKPLFVGDDLNLSGQRVFDGTMDAWASDHNGHLAGSVQLRFA